MFSRLKILPLLLALVSVPAFAADSAADVGQQLWKFLHAHGYGALKTDNSETNRQMMDACINGHWISMMVDTGCETTCLTDSCARDIGLSVQAAPGQDSGIGGKVEGRTGVALVSSFKLKTYEINRTNIIHVLSPGAELDSKGLFGYDFLRLNAVLLPVGANFILFKPGASPVVSVDPFMTGLGYHATKLTFGKGGLRTTATLNGHTFTAVVDCGSSLTMFDGMFVSKTAGLALSSYAASSTGLGLSHISLSTQGVDGRRLQAYEFSAKSLAFGGTSFGSPDTIACYDSVLPTLDAEAFLGYDLLAAHEAIIDLGHNVLWMK